ncbi:hypothetical protein LTR53_009733 [Teratosphaeriaceae sp. CCFEE 6253]|nr:hypothetical protein LTR53_009733 [Teratosphaeriaceae sp. CCFEE 6253]
MAVGDLVLVTGATGFIGFRTLRYTLEKGYRVRAAVRSEAKGDSIRSNATLANITDLSSKLTFVVVPDITAQGAFDEAVKGVVYVLHVASPLSNAAATVQDDLDLLLIKPAVLGTLGMLESARKQSSVKRIVITSSMVAIPPIGALTGQAPTEHVYKPEERADDLSAPWQATIVAYVQSKIAALKQAEAWVKKNSPHFDVIHIHPSFVGGRNDTARNIEELTNGTNFYFLAPALGQEAVKATGPLVANIVDVDDVAKAHVESLNESVAGNQSFFLTNAGGDVKWNDVRDIVAKHFPDAVAGGVLPNDGDAPYVVIKVDIGKTEETFGKLKSFEETIVGLVGQYLELKGKEKK